MLSRRAISLLERGMRDSVGPAGGVELVEDLTEGSASLTCRDLIMFVADTFRPDPLLLS
jgi:hypothetical protein